MNGATDAYAKDEGRHKGSALRVLAAGNSRHVQFLVCGVEVALHDRIGVVRVKLRCHYASPVVESSSFLV
jgi:hypothetical protein